ncbi:hypothetical protein [Ensifer soli]|uniref:hypothetical protein n=1 Tax=Ciceribacter sp. sgz301302 TaxID=3342379 RepID=UPI0035BAD435
MRLYASFMLFLLPVFSPSSALAAGVRDDLMEKIADVVALARVCPSLEMDTVSVTTIAIGQQIGRHRRDYEVIDAMANAREGEMRRGDAPSACESGRRQYGPGGLTVPGLLRER